MLASINSPSIRKRMFNLVLQNVRALISWGREVCVCPAYVLGMSLLSALHTASSRDPATPVSTWRRQSLSFPCTGSTLTNHRSSRDLPALIHGWMSRNTYRPSIITIRCRGRTTISSITGSFKEWENEGAFTAPSVSMT